MQKGKSFVDWNLPLREQAMILEPANAEQKRLKALVYPLAESYLSPVPAIFLHRLPDLRAFFGKPILVARDGAIPLLLFFRKFRQPPVKLTGKIAVHESLLPWVPPPWQEAVVSYRLVIPPAQAPAASVFIYGINSSALVSPESCGRALAAAAGAIAGAGKRYLCLPSFFFSRNEPLQMHAEIARLIFLRTGTDIEVVEWGKFLLNRDLAGCQVISLMKSSLVADSWLTHTMVRMGATNGSRPPDSDERFFPLSRAHGLALKMHPEFPALDAIARRTEEDALLSSPEAAAIDWARIFSCSAKQLQLEKGRPEAGSREESKNLYSLSGL